MEVQPKDSSTSDAKECSLLYFCRAMRHSNTPHPLKPFETMPVITIDTHSGFCFGVVRAIAEAERQLSDKNASRRQTQDDAIPCNPAASNGHAADNQDDSSPRNPAPLYCLGEIVHNTEEVQRLESLGLRIIDMEQFRQLKDAKVLIRAHGEPPSTYQIAQKNRIQLIDATCPIVLKLQQRIKAGFEQMQAQGGQVLIFGKAGHAEVIGLNGQTGNRAIVVGSLQEVEKLDFSKPTMLFSQTTMDAEKYAEIARYIAAQCQKHQVEFKSVDSICKSMSQRAGQLRAFSLQQDAIVFVSGKQSSNGKYLYSICRSYNPNTFFVSSADELKAGDFLDAQGRNRFARIGVCGATSTPMWLMEDVAQHIHQFCPDPTDASGNEPHSELSQTPKCTPDAAVPQSGNTVENRPASDDSKQPNPKSESR